MAVSASISIEQISQNIANNTSTIRVTGTATTTGASHNLNTLTGTVTIDGASQNFNCSLPYTSTTTLFSITKTIAHNADGTRSVGASFSLDTRISAGVVTRSATRTLTTIPRATTPSLSPSSVTMGKDIVIALSRASSAFTHTLQHDFQAGTWTTFATGAATSAVLTVPEEWAARLPNAAQGTGKIRCLTYNGSTLIGEKTVSFTAIVPDSIVPTVDSITVAEATAGIADKFGTYIQGKSTLKVTSAGSGAQGSTISKHLVEVLGKPYEGAEVTTGVINRSGDVDIKVTVTDSRGRMASKTVAVVVLGYSVPTISRFDAFRCDANGAEKNGSKNLNCVYAFKVASCNGKNDKSYKIEYKRDAEDGWTTLASGEQYEANANYLALDLLDLEYSYNVRLTVTDYFTSAMYELKAGTEIVPLCIYPTGKGLGIGGYPTKEALQVFFPTEFNSSLKIMGKTLVDLIHPVGDVVSNASADFNPNELYPGTAWERIKGRVLIGVDEDDTDFETAGLVGGNKTLELRAQIGATDNNVNRIGYRAVGAITGTYNKNGMWVDGSANYQGAINPVNHNTPVLDTKQKNDITNIMNPYETVYMWKRTA